jgi:uncharacterized protein
MLLRIALFLVAVFAALWMVRGLAMARRAKPTPPSSQKSTALLPCAHCGTYTPQPEGVLHNGLFYCSLDHAQAAQAKPQQ